MLEHACAEHDLLRVADDECRADRLAAAALERDVVRDISSSARAHPAALHVPQLGPRAMRDPPEGLH
eukprot:7513812-Heterocapsa_arctica.AAC.1